ncbi:hypothetical protein CDAR_549031 [Caerostris darwini]|uniref:Uncharacterized protein n=1 Tax=Caerostris darwini TaxID=1538125 RepID=A0AAV4WI55_9ARAC|nr:hypothetical protein CDAR_549031 [Caerostris darwini]
MLNYSKPWMVIRGSEGVHSQSHQRPSCSTSGVLSTPSASERAQVAGLTQIQERQMHARNETVSRESAILEQATCTRNAFVTHFQACRRCSEKLIYSLLNVKRLSRRTQLLHNLDSPANHRNHYSFFISILVTRK